MKSRVLIILLVLSGAAVSIYFFIVDKKPSIRNIILISMDTTRADHLSCYGYKPETTPNIDAVARHAFVFENAVSPVPLTLPSHSTMFTGTIPPYHGVHDNLSNFLSDSNLTIAELLKENNFITSAIVSSFVLDSQFGLDQGFDHYDDHLLEKPDQYNSNDNLVKTPYQFNHNERIGKDVTENATNWIEEHKDEKFFLFLHYYDPHAEYTPQEPFASKYKSSPYAGEIAYTDHCIGQVLDKLKKLKLYDSTLLIITADHGEMLGSHGEISHGFYIYREAVGVPLIIKIPGKQPGCRINSPVGIIDIFPTICSLLGIEIPDNIQGVDIMASTKADNVSEPERYIYSESFTPTKYNANSLLGLTGNRYKYIQTTIPELYDLADDPSETKNIVKSNPNLVRILQDKLKHTIKSAESSRAIDSKLKPDTESIERLKSLGYIGGQITEDLSFNQDKANPSEVIDYYNDLGCIVKLIYHKKLDQARTLCLNLISKQPEILEPYNLMAKISLCTGENNSAITYLKKLTEMAPEMEWSHNALAFVYFKLSEYNLACESLQNSLKLNPDQLYAHNALAGVYIKLSEYKIACESQQNSLKSNHDQPSTHIRSGISFEDKKTYQKALYHLNESLKLDCHQTSALNQLAKIYHLQNNTTKTIEYITKSLSINSNQPKILNTLAIIYYTKSDIYKALEYWLQILSFAPDNIDANNSIAWIKSTSKDKKFRDPSMAIVLAQKACKLTEYGDPAMLDTLAAAYACAGEFIKAVESAQKGIEAAKSTGDTTLSSELNKRIVLYQRNKPYIE